MSAQRARIVAAQAAVVGVLLLVVYVTLLRSDGGSSLFGVDLPRRGPQTAQDPRVGSERPGGDAQGGERPRGTGIAAVPGAALGTPSLPAPPAAPAGEGQGPDELTPAGEQYSDTLKQLLSRVGAGG